MDLGDWSIRNWRALAGLTSALLVVARMAQGLTAAMMLPQVLGLITASVVVLGRIPADRLYPLGLKLWMLVFSSGRAYCWTGSFSLLREP